MFISHFPHLVLSLFSINLCKRLYICILVLYCIVIYGLRIIHNSIHFLSADPLGLFIYYFINIIIIIIIIFKIIIIFFFFFFINVDGTGSLLASIS